MLIRICGSFHNFGVLFVGVLVFFGSVLGGPEFWKLPFTKIH